MKVLVIAIGSRGDVNPFLAIALKLKHRGHEVVFCTSENYLQLAEGQGLRFLPHFSRQQYEAVINDPDLWHFRKALPTLIKKGLLPAMRIIYPLIMRERSSDFVVVSTPFALAAKLAEEKEGIKVVNLHLAPCMFRTLQDAAQLGGLPMSPQFPAGYKKLVWWLTDTIVVDPCIKKELNAVRHELRLAPVSRVLDRWFFSSCFNAALFSRYLSQPQPDWPAPSEVFDFLLYDGDEQVSAEAEQFIRQGEPPIVFTFGTAFYFGKNIFQESAKAPEMIGARGIFLTARKDAIPDPLPPGIMVCFFLPLGRVLSSCRAIVHHGGVGTLGQALNAGIPQLIRPMAYDQFDNAYRVTTRKYGSYILARQYSAERLARKLAAMLADQEIITSCREVSRRIDSETALERLAARIEEIGRTK